MHTSRARWSFSEQHHDADCANETLMETLSLPTFWVRRAFTTDVLFAERLVEENTARFYTRRGEKWTASRFLSIYDEHETFILFAGAKRAGVLQVKVKADGLWITALEVGAEYKTKGLASSGIEYALTLARRYGHGTLRVKLFSESCALDLYKQLGFTTYHTDGNMIWLERSTSLI